MFFWKGEQTGKDRVWSASSKQQQFLLKKKFKHITLWIKKWEKEWDKITAFKKVYKYYFCRFLKLSLSIMSSRRSVSCGVTFALEGGFLHFTHTYPCQIYIKEKIGGKKLAENAYNLTF